MTKHAENHFSPIHCMLFTKQWS